MPEFRWWEGQGHDPDRPYDTLLLNRLKDNAGWVRQNRGNHIVHNFKTSSSSDTQKDHIRPYCSVSRWLTIFRAPYFVPAGLQRLECGLLCRVSNTDLDDIGSDSLYQGLGLDVRTFFETDSGSGTQTIVPVLSGNEVYWQWASWYYDLSSEVLTSAGGEGGYSHLHLAIKSRCPINPGDKVYDVKDGTYHDAVLNAYDIDSRASNHRLKVQQTGAFDEGSSSSAPAHKANEVCCFGTGIVGADGNHTLSGRFADAQRRQSNVSGQGLYVSSPGLEVGGYSKAYRLVASYIQPVSFEVREVYA
ncbi:hypothetical protein FIV42_00650 [Persicimonas caeni]|uniref:Uncharacterized protein n=1 Tax=Persicimonas caeni TaxID=2292766 RepID=A0A4Y6PM54_PERCE|nr:hypothetical protein [Persicimonas caeni]QDG49293.1 hypothetical protein FIV42_00650 [Persicimonas caeni]QED30514.1 hypothetical protein FRD00_00645 [Persicimonas caeni]